MYKLGKNGLRRGIAAIMASICFLTAGMPANAARASKANDYSNAIYTNGTQDTYVYDMLDKVITTKTGIKRTIPKTSGKYDRSQYPIPLVSSSKNKEEFELIKAENKALMNQVEADIKNGTLTKHIAADGQFYGSIADDVTGVEKKVYVNTNAKGTHSLGAYVPAGEIATITLSEEALIYAKKGMLKLSVGMTRGDNAEEFEYNNDENNRMPYLGKTFSVTEKDTKVGTPFGGMVYIEIDQNVPSGLQFEVLVKGVVDTPYYELGQTTEKEWKESQKAAGLFAEIRTPYLRFTVPSYFIREIEGIEKACQFWTNATALSATVMAQEDRDTPMTMIFDNYITAGVAYASVGSWTCTVPNEWALEALSYKNLMTSGSWGMIHEINHHYQSRKLTYWDEWGLGSQDAFGEITNNVLNAISYILYTNIAAYRGEDGTEDWNKVVDPYSSLKQQIFEGEAYYKGVPNMGNFVYSTLAHEIGPVMLANVIKSTYEDTIFNGIKIPAYDYAAERDGKKTREERYDDFAYRICVASERDYTWYLQEELRWPLTTKMVQKIESLKLEKVIPVQSVYAMGEEGRETGRPFYVPSTGYTFDFEKYLVSPGKTKVTGVSTPKYGSMKRLDDGTYSYMPSKKMPEGQTDEFTLTVLVTGDGISRETKLTCKIGILYNNVNVEHHAITKWDIYEALETLKDSTPYKTTSSNGMKITTDDGNNLAKSTGYFSVTESGEYTFQAFGDDRAVFMINEGEESSNRSLTVDYAASAEDAYKQAGATHFNKYLEAGKAYSYTLISNNNGGSGWADVNIKATAEDARWEAIDTVCNDIENFGKSSDRAFTAPTPIYVRPSKVAASDNTTVKGVSVVSTPQGVKPNEDAESSNEGDPNNIVDGDASTYFHSTYIEEDKTAMPHEYVFDLGNEHSFNQMEVLYRRSGDDCGVIGDYEIYIADSYDGENTKWTLLTKDETRHGNADAPNDITASLDMVTGRYVMLRVLNNRGEYDLSILAEVTFSMNSTVNNVIAQDSSYIQYVGAWSKDTEGAYVNGATYNTKDGYFKYCFNGSQSNIYVTKEASAEVRVDGGAWKSVALTGSLREPSATITMAAEGEHSVEVRAKGQELALNMISTDGTFYKGGIVSVDNKITILGASNIKMPISKVDSFNPLAGISYKDELGQTGLTIKVTGKVGKPSAGTNADYKLTYSVTDMYQNTVSVERVVTVTNQVPKINGLADISIKKGEGKGFNYQTGVTVTDHEDGAIKLTEVPTLDLSTLSVGDHTVTYAAKDSDGNVTKASRKIKVAAVTTAVVVPAVTKLTASTVSTSQIKLTWAKVSSATGYKIYRYNESTKNYSLVKTITKNSTLSYTDSKLASGTTYKYRVVAYKGTTLSKEAEISGTTKPATIVMGKLTTAKKSAVVRWSKVARATGYEVYRSTSKNGKYVKVSTITKGNTVTYTNSKLTAKKTYYYKVRAYKTVKNKKIYGDYSKVKSIKVVK